ncbi:TPA: transporter substrate-binding domain-containing protein [Vibrio alginolyticus]|uniref:GGDEF domain-containing protein n=1 Tax=Vibrio TaxID=662 RepID=UPI001A24D1ED|nr:MULTISPECIES: GGDEF domain-containing protein [Vibrio]EGQ7763125.1 transporter substrate-binding domain-containing protein [Vibrio alginolyticus]EGQ8448738.1 transporter substrate-binding domain-containing protein [Vibrio alginolyticus]EGR2610158.1 GGDEF domain-containing protein [Vibrio alginolyticus]EJA7357052.1 transporter substrate-binding domain-containing protein [Vibrio alginolyticus]EJV5948376.1 transporter substrate-binding domain-containing protein [Vibrio alginolyticus]
MTTFARTLLLFACCHLSLNVKAEAPLIAHYKVATEADDVVTRVLFNAASEEFGFTVQYVNYSSFDAILNSVANGEADFAANITYTQERAQRFSYSRPTNIEYTYLFGLKDSTLSDISRVGVPKDTVYAQLLKQHYPELEQISYQGHEQAVTLLRSGAVDGVVDAINQLKPMLMEGFDAKMLNDQISIKPVSIISKKDHHLEELDTFATFIHGEAVQKQLREEISQYQFELRRAALRDSIRLLPLDFNEPIRIKLESIFPYVVYNADGSVEGMTADVVLRSCEILALNCLIISEPGESWGSMYHEFIQGNFEILAPLTVSRERRAFSYFPKSHYAPASVMVKRLGYKPSTYSHVSQLISERIGVVKDDFFDQMMTQLLPLKELKRYRTQQELIQGLLNEEVDYIPMDTAMLNHFLRLSELVPIEQDTAIGEFYESQLSVGLVANEKGAMLAPFFSRAIAMLEVDKIIAQYDVRPDWRTALEYEIRLATQTQAVFIFVLLFAICVSLYLYRQSNTDNLTGLRNRRALQVKYRKGVNKDLSILYLDINHFKRINDTYGHRAGDEVLQLLALKIHYVWSGRCYRIGGDEFILLGYPTQAELTRAMRELSRIDVKGKLCSDLESISISIGFSAKRERHMSLEQAMHLADEDMYMSKQSSRHDSSYRDCTVSS